MSMLYAPPPPPPPETMTSSQPYSTTHGSIGAVIGVLAVVVVLGIGAILIGRLCSGRGIMSRSGTHNYDMESWVETKCSSCVDGRIVLSRPPPAQPPSPSPPPVQGDGRNEPATEEESNSNAAS